MADEEFVKKLDDVVTEGWRRIHNGSFFSYVREHAADRELYRRTMWELWHYIQHNPLNQAVAVLGAPATRTHLVRYAIEHAHEEISHEKMIEHDLRAVGLLEPEMYHATPLPSTQAFIAYLYYVGLTQGAVARMGYSYWAERANDQIGELLDRCRDDLGLTDRELSFFVAHSTIDAKHSKDVEDALERHATTPQLQAQVIDVARTTLYLNEAMLAGVLDSYLAARG